MDWTVVYVLSGLILLSAVFRFWICPRFFNPIIARVVVHVPGWAWPVLLALLIVFGQWARGGGRMGAAPWVYEFGAGVGLVLGTLLWIAEVRYGKTKAAFRPRGPEFTTKAIDDDL